MKEFNVPNVINIMEKLENMIVALVINHGFI
jgi:hypothetical protein